MAFYSPDAAMGQQLAAALLRLEAAGHPGLGERLAITWLRYSRSRLPRADRSRSATAPAAVAPGGAGWRSGVPQDPGGLERLAYLLACERWLQRDLLLDCGELRGAMVAMAQRGSLEATSLVVDLLSGTTSGPRLPADRQRAWERQRQLVNDWLSSLHWPELQGCNACQKLWHDGPYGRERDGFGADGSQANRFSSDALARLLDGVIAGTLISPPAGQRLRLLLQRPLPADRHKAMDPAPPDSLAAILPPGMPLWSLDDPASRRRHGALYGEPPGQPPFLLVVLDRGDGGDPLLAALAEQLLAAAPADSDSPSD
ncbi:MAG: hypothetical protein VKJ44_01335 [Synechococcus sp.]|nr:hypothetical protein [Synechococcus sp.]